MIVLRHLITIIIASLLTLYIKPRLIEILEQNNLLATNYSGKVVINGAGLIFFIPCILSVFSLWSVVDLSNMLIYIILILSMTLVGYLDDSLGTATIKGLRGHIKDMMTGNISTGIVKLIISLVIGIVISTAYFSSYLDVFFHVFLFCLCVNFINLLDLRPGRSIKGFLFFTLYISISSGFKYIWMLLPIYGSLAVYIKDEMREVYMLGDTGANLLGGVLGIFTLKAASPRLKYTIFIVLMFLHVLAEFRSFSSIIETVPLLKYLDSFGQLRKERS